MLSAAEDQVEDTRKIKRARSSEQAEQAEQGAQPSETASELSADNSTSADRKKPLIRKGALDKFGSSCKYGVGVERKPRVGADFQAALPEPSRLKGSKQQKAAGPDAAKQDFALSEPAKQL